uniref:RAB GTPase activating protein 1-like 2 n=1 Tax=Periophthalmus magnuspinnatus TaxID=409849 RepID=A0A3B4B4G9_9GOBI
MRESRLQIMDSDDEEDSLDKYLKENQRLQEASLRLEQENDNLAHRLISSKVALRSALDQAEDKVDVLSKDLVFTQHELQVTQDQMRSKEEEATMLKDVFRKELEKADQNIQRSSGIIADYKQICSQLTERLERQQAAHRQEIDSIKVRMGTDNGAPQDSSRDGKEKESFKDQIRELEQELARTKLQMVEAKCKIQVQKDSVVPAPATTARSCTSTWGRCTQGAHRTGAVRSPKRHSTPSAGPV